MSGRWIYLIFRALTAAGQQVQSSLVKVAQDQWGLDLLLEEVWEEMQMIIQKQTAAGQEKWGATINMYLLAQWVNEKSVSVTLYLYIF